MPTPTIETRESAESARNLGDVSCGICRRQISRYTCPSCNLSYCSLNCFRSEPHSRCSETFYRKEIEIEVKSAPTRAEEDRNKIIELLKRVEGENTANEDEPFGHSDEENGEDSLARRFSRIDISSASADDLLRLLTKKERDKFFAALKEPSSGLVQELLDGPELGKTGRLPWWETPSDGGGLPLSPNVPVKPDLMAIPASLITQASGGISLLYNICAVLLAYAYVTRHLSMSPFVSTANDSQDYDEARRIFSQAVPFLVDGKSNLRHMSLTDAVVSFWSQLDPGSIDNRTMLVLLEDIAKLVRPRMITVMTCPSTEREETMTLATDHPFEATIMAISDISFLFGTGAGSRVVAGRRSHIVMKLTFYAAHILSTASSRLHLLADEINIFSTSITNEVVSKFINKP